MNYKALSLILGSSILLAACGGKKDSADEMAEFELTITNVTAAQPLSPVASVVADAGYRIFELGEPASLGLEHIAEGGDTGVLLASLAANDTVILSKTGSGIIPPGNSETLVFQFPRERLNDAYLSAVSMLVNTNDGITAVQGIRLMDLEVGKRWIQSAMAYDAGTEANTEAAGSIPGPADGGEGFNATRDDTRSVRVHAGVITTAGGHGSSVLSEQHRFDNPVAVFSLRRIE